MQKYMYDHSSSFPSQLILLSVVQEKEYMKMILTKWLTIWLRSVVSPLTRWRVEMIIPILFMKLRLGHTLIQIRPTRHTWLVKILLVKVMPCRVGVIRVERGQSRMQIIIKVEKIVVIIHITQELSKQTNKRKEERKNLA